VKGLEQPDDKLQGELPQSLSNSAVDAVHSRSSNVPGKTISFSTGRSYPK